MTFCGRIFMVSFGTFLFPCFPMTEQNEKTKKCPKCKESILSGATKCKHCGGDLRNYFVRHKVITGILVLIVLGIIGSALGEDTTKTSTSTPTNNAAVEKSASKVTKANCDSVRSGMTREQVINLLGEPSSTSESEIAGFGKSEFLHFQEGFSTKACSITLSNGKVMSKTWTDL